MPSLYPLKNIFPETPPDVDLARVFGNADCRESLERVVDYISRINQKYGSRSFDEIRRENVVTEEFFMFMPTRAAYDAEIALCTAIVAHSQMFIEDAQIKTDLKNYLDTHTFVYCDNGREVKKGDFDSWQAGVELFYVYSPDDKSISATCNAVQMWLFYLMNKNLKLRMVRL